MNRISIVAPFLIFVFCAIEDNSKRVFADGDTPPAALASVQKAKALVESGQHDEAVSILDASIRQHENAGVLYLTRAVLQQNAAQDKLAINDFSRAIELGFRPALAQASRGLSRLTLGDRKGAIADLNTAIQNNPNLAMAYLLRGRIYCEANQLPLALKDLNDAIRLDPSAESYVARASCHLKIGDHSGACRDASRAAALDRSDPTPIYVRMAAHLGRGDRKAASADYELAKKLDATRTP